MDKKEDVHRERENQTSSSTTKRIDEITDHSSLDQNLLRVLRTQGPEVSTLHLRTVPPDWECEEKRIVVLRYLPSFQGCFLLKHLRH